MPRPSPEQRKKIEANKLKNAKVKAAWDAQDKQVAKIINDALEHSRATPLDILPDLPEIMGKLESAFQLAMASKQPGHAVTAAMAQAKLRGLLIDQQLVVSSSVRNSDLSGDSIELLRDRLEQIREMLGSERADKLISTMRSQGLIPGNLLDRAELNLTADDAGENDETD